MSITKITDIINYIGVYDKDIDLFESQYLVPNGVTYNSYLIKDEKTALMDTVDFRGCEEWLNNLDKSLGDKNLDYIVCLHMEPDHSGSLKNAILKYPNAKIIGNVKTFTMIEKFFKVDLTDRKIAVAEGESISLGKSTLTFYMAPMVHWPEVMVAYESNSKTLFSADAFGTFGTFELAENWADEARRYYLNIVGKYGVQVQSLLKKASGLDIARICPLHGPVLSENLGYYIDKYSVWSSYQAENNGITIACASIHGNTLRVANILKEKLLAKGIENVVLYDLSRDDMSKAIASAFQYDKLILACATYDGGLFPPMESFIHHLKSKNYQKRKVGIIENGTWAPTAAKNIKDILATFKEIEIYEQIVTITSTENEISLKQMDNLIEELI